MSLQIWLPLNGNLNNQGLSDAVVAVGTTPTYVNGKIGKAISTGSFTIPAAKVKDIYNNNAMSFAFWLYPIGTTGSQIILGQNPMTAGNNRMYSIFQYPTPNDLHLSWQDETSSSTFLASVHTGFFAADTWTHCAITYDGSVARIYKNGTLFTTVSGKSNRANFEYDVPFASSNLRNVCDLRIYNYVLSPKEVKEIAKGLVLHYPLNDSSIEDTTNLLPANTYNHVSMGGYWNGTVAATTFDGCKCFSITNSTTNSYGDGFISGAATLTAGNTYTYSGYIYVPTGKSFRVGMRLSNGGGAENITIIGNDQWQYFSHTFTATSSMTGAIEGNETSNYTNSTVYYIRNLQIEQKDHATQFAAGTRSNNIIYDCSGFGYNGTKSGAILLSGNTPRYNNSCLFSGSSYIKTTSPTSEAKTMSLWVYIGNSLPVSKVLAVDYKSKLSLGFQSSSYIIVSCGDSTNAVAQYSPSSIKLNGWNHIVSIKDDSNNYSLYINGVNITSTNGTNYWTQSTDETVIAARNNGSYNTMFDNKISDFRLYASSLSAEDIKELYNVGMSIDNQGNLFCGEVVE